LREGKRGNGTLREGKRGNGTLREEKRGNDTLREGKRGNGTLREPLSWVKFSNLIRCIHSHTSLAFGVLWKRYMEKGTIKRGNDES
jgi:hypothetical protein